MKRLSALCVCLLLISTHPVFATRVDRKTYQRRVQEAALKESLNQFEASPFSVLAEDGIPSSQQSGIRVRIQSTVSSISRDFTYDPQGPMQLLLLHTSDYEKIGPDFSSSGFYQNKTIRMAWPQDQNEPEQLDYFKRIFRHEFTHLVLAQATGNKIPRWLNEGLAVYEEVEGRRGGYGEGKAFYQRMLDEGKQDRLGEHFFARNLTTQYTEDGQDYYAQSYLLAKYLLETCGWEKMKNVFYQMKTGTSFSQAFSETCLLTVLELAQRTYNS
ncbi:MAG: hypothetical protein EXS63_04900 [Candidatus Omnitrophica bacterium]|nr:hypothetical protein [Candidatus Omnitrophota bacterium]